MPFLQTRVDAVRAKVGRLISYKQLDLYLGEFVHKALDQIRHFSQRNSGSACYSQPAARYGRTPVRLFTRFSNQIERKADFLSIMNSILCEANRSRTTL